MRFHACAPLFRLAAILAGVVSLTARPATCLAVDPLADAAVAALSQLTDPRRLEALTDEAFPAQLGPALGWLHVARRRDVAPESIIARAFALNGLAGERARLTREALLRNLARADSWELFGHPASALALSFGKPAQIPVGIHRGHLAQAAVILPEGFSPLNRREFACLVLRADDEMPYTPPTGPRRRQPGDMLARSSGGRRASSASRPRTPKPAAAAVPMPALNAIPISYDDALPVF